MKIDWFVKSLLLIIVIFLGIIALRHYMAPPLVKAESFGTYYPLYVEPGPVSLPARDGRSNALGRVVIDLRNGNVWEFPDLSSGPSSVNAFNPTVAISHPFLLGRWALADMDK
jgi:hypothetical protein